MHNLQSLCRYRVIVWVLGALIPQTARSEPASGLVKEADAGATIQEIILSDPIYKHTYADSYASRDNPEFYVYEILAIDPLPSSQHVGLLEINRRTGEIWVVTGSVCDRYPLSAGKSTEPVNTGSGVELPLDCR
jgi:hypothetical protein